MSIISISGKLGSGKDTVAKMIQYLTMGAADPNTWGETPEYGFKEFVERGHSSLCGYWEVKKFAGKLKQIVSLLTGIPVADLEKPEVKDRELGPEWDRYSYGLGGYANKADHDALRMTYTGERKFITKEQYDQIVADGHQEHHQARHEKMTVRRLLQALGTDAMRDKVHPNIHVSALFADYKPAIYRDIVPARVAGFRDTEVWPNWLISDMRFKNELEDLNKRGGITIRVNRPILQRLGVIHKDEHPSETELDNAKFKHTINNDGSLDELLEQVRQILLTEKII